MQTKLLVGLGALWVIDAGDDARDFEDVFRNLRRHDVAVVTLCDGHEAVGVLDARSPQHIGVGSVADHLVALEVAGQNTAGRGPGELVGVPVDDHDLMAGLVHVGGDLGTHATTPHNQQLQAALIIGRASRDLRPTLLAFGPLRFPFTFMGLMALGIGLWVVAYLAGHPALDPVARGIAAVTVAICWVLGGYVLVRRVRRGPQH